VITRRDGRFLLGQRAPETFYAGFWEFPGGKVEPGESPREALVRELEEELGIRVLEIRPWITREHCYEHADVRLHFFEVLEWEGEVNDRVHSALSWELPEKPAVSPMLPANGPVLKSLRLPRCMGITYAGALGSTRQLALIESALERGLRLIQIRESEMAAGEFEVFAREVVRLAHISGAIAVVNGDVLRAQAVGADGVHLSAAALAVATERPACEWVGASCHDRAELERAAALGVDYAVLGSVLPTPTHPEQPGIGWAAFETLIRGLTMPVFALGGVGQADMETARRAGAHGFAAIRGAWLQSR
jgi:8-oxo-dGTP diphosphatase